MTEQSLPPSPSSPSKAISESNGKIEKDKDSSISKEKAGKIHYPEGYLARIP